MRAELFNRIIGFVRSIANECHSCLRRNSDSCNNCISNYAKVLMKDIAIDEAVAESHDIDYSYGARSRAIVEILKRAGKPLLAVDIDLGDVCSPQLKNWTLKQMIQHGILGRQFAYRQKSKGRERVFFSYYLKTKNKETK